MLDKNQKAPIVFLLWKNIQRATKNLNKMAKINIFFQTPQKFKKYSKEF